MAAFIFHRKILDDLTNATVTVAVQSCKIQCDPQKNPSASCDLTCCPICPSFCRSIDSSPAPTNTYVPSSLSPPLDHHHRSPFSLTIKISLVVLVLTFSLFLLYTLYKFYTVWYRSRRRRSPPPPPSPDNQETRDEFIDHDALDHPIWYIRTIGLQPSVISAITVMKYSKSEGLVDGTDCSVCLSEFQEDETLRLLPKCNHAFHISCIDTWLRSHTNCPLCRAGIVINTVNSPSPEQNTADSGPTEETHVTISIPDEEDGEGSELRIRADEEDLNDKAGEVFDERAISDFLNTRRSVSLDESSDNYSEINRIQVQSVDGDLGTESVKIDQTTGSQNQNQNQSLLRLVGSSSIGRSLQISPSFMRRSISCNGKVLLSRHSSRGNNPSS